MVLAAGAARIHDQRIVEHRSVALTNAVETLCHLSNQPHMIRHDTTSQFLGSYLARASTVANLV